MKNAITKAVVFLIGVIILGSGIFYLVLVGQYGLMKKQMRQVAHVVIYQQEEIKGLDRIEFTICDSMYHFSKDAIQDTISENLGISDDYFPCLVRMRYTFEDGTQKGYVIDSFDCGGCSGSHNYILAKERIRYCYHP